MSGDVSGEMSPRFRIVVAQLTSSDNPNHNADLVLRLFEEAASAAGGCDLVVFPENTLFFRIQTGAAIQGLTWQNPIVQRLQAVIDRIAGAGLMMTTPFMEDSKKLVNATLFFAPQASPQLLYRKVHLFDVDVPGAPPVRESDFFQPGGEPVIWEWRGWKFGLSICYDLRFSELYARYAQKVDVILIPSAFLVPTGEAHWHVLVRARAIENQCYVAAPAQFGEHRSSEYVRKTFGHSLVVDPWGRVLCDLSESPKVAAIELERAALEQVRAQIPMSAHRRLLESV